MQDAKYQKPNVADVLYAVRPLYPDAVKCIVSRVGKTLFDVETIEDGVFGAEVITFRIATRREKTHTKPNSNRRALTLQELQPHKDACERIDLKTTIYFAAHHWKYSEGVLTDDLEDLREACRLLGITTNKTIRDIDE